MVAEKAEMAIIAIIATEAGMTVAAIEAPAGPHDPIQGRIYHRLVTDARRLRQQHQREEETAPTAEAEAIAEAGVTATTVKRRRIDVTEEIGVAEQHPSLSLPPYIYTVSLPSSSLFSLVFLKLQCFDLMDRSSFIYFFLIPKDFFRRIISMIKNLFTDQPNLT